MDDPHLFLHTGGSTGVPKETVLTHGSILWNSFNTITAWGLRPEDVTPMVFPMFHTGGWNVVTVPLFHLGGTVVLAREFEPGEVLRFAESEGATVLVAVPAVLRMMATHDDWETTDLSALRFAKSGGGPCRESVMEAWWDRGVDLSQGYGLTECGPNNFTMPEGWPREKADSVGVPAMHVDARVVDADERRSSSSSTRSNDDGEELPAGGIGELELSSPHAAAGYWRNQSETEETFGDGWVSTGDLARRDEDGYYYIEGRKKNMYVSGGENVYPAAVEDRIADHPKVEEVVVVPVPDDQWGQVGKAVVQGDESLTLAELTEFLDGKLARFKRPRHLAFVDEMPTSGPQKIDRQAVEDRFGEE
nr:AMP-binding protein [Halorussus sp. MSC15.2]